MLRIRRPSPALAIAVLALFISMSGTAVAAGVVPMAKKALFAVNAGKLKGKTLAQVAAMPGPSSSAGSLVSTVAIAFSLAPNEEKDIPVQCPSGAKAISGGFTSPNLVLGLDTRPSADGTGWSVYIANLSATQGAAGSVHAICLR